MTQDTHRALIAGLVDEKHRHLYMTSAHFKHAVDTLAQMLPLMVDGFAVNAEKKDAEMAVAMEYLTGLRTSSCPSEEGHGASRVRCGRPLVDGRCYLHGEATR